MNLVDQLAFKGAALLATQREVAARVVCRDRLPKHLKWLVDHPRLLRLAYRVRPKWRPVMHTSTDLDVTVYSARTSDGVTYLFDQPVHF